VFRPALKSTQPPVQWVPGVFSPVVNRGRGVALTTHPHLVPKWRMSRKCNSSPPCCLHGVAGQLYFFCFAVNASSLGHIIRLHLISVIILKEEYKLWRQPLSSLSRLRITSSLWFQIFTSARFLLLSICAFPYNRGSQSAARILSCDLVSVWRHIVTRYPVLKMEIQKHRYTS
jgi:hypothetical protein